MENNNQLIKLYVDACKFGYLTVIRYWWARGAVSSAESGCLLLLQVKFLTNTNKKKSGESLIKRDRLLMLSFCAHY